MLTNLTILALLSAFMILLIDKLGIRSFFIEKLPVKIIAKMFSCDFCLSFWVAMFISIIFMLCTHEVNWLILPVFTSPLTRLLI